MLLGDAGASVIKVERPNIGDDTRRWGPPYVGLSEKNRLSTYFVAVNRNKKSIAVDIKQQAGLDIVKRLATEWADVVVENYKRGTMEKVGLGYEDLVSKNKKLVYCSISGFGPDGPLSHYPGYDVIISGMYGLMSITGDEDGPPAKVGVASTDVLTGTLAQSGILSALYARQQTGIGQKVDVSLMESQLAGLVNIASSSLNNSNKSTPPPKRWGTAHESIVPYQAFQCKYSNDNNTEIQYIMVGAGNDSHFANLCNGLNIPEIAKDSRYLTNSSRVDNRKSLLSVLEKIFLTKTRDEWYEILNGNGFPVGPLRNVQEAFQCKQAQHRGMVQQLQHPVVGNIQLPRTPISFASPPTSILGEEIKDSKNKDQQGISILPPPMLGENTREILHNTLQMDHQLIQQLEKDKVIECWENIM
jgi:crotonobetainyl-CoA:carnitine CoA-transferase CaiB-like acyl-CoA transferase